MQRRLAGASNWSLAWTGSGCAEKHIKIRKRLPSYYQGKRFTGEYV